MQGNALHFQCLIMFRRMAKAGVRGQKKSRTNAAFNNIGESNYSATTSKFTVAAISLNNLTFAV
jgi:hypothetical protein